jgi:hypothetical protein
MYFSREKRTVVYHNPDKPCPVYYAGSLPTTAAGQAAKAKQFNQGWRHIAAAQRLLPAKRGACVLNRCNLECGVFFEGAAASKAMPSWLPDSVFRDITGDTTFLGVALAQQPTNVSCSHNHVAARVSEAAALIASPCERYILLLTDTHTQYQNRLSRP